MDDRDVAVSYWDVWGSGGSGSGFVFLFLASGLWFRV